MQKSAKNNLYLVVWILGLLAVSKLLGTLTQQALPTNWYLELNRSPLTPPGYVFGICWSILYVLIAISGWILFNRSSRASEKNIKVLFVLQLLLNWSWTPIFFTMHQIFWGFICILLILLCLTALIVGCYRHLRTVSFLLLPYYIWSLFAAYLNYFIWIHN